MVTLEQARAEPKLRQSYSEQVDLGEFARYVKDVGYICSKNVFKSDKKTLMCVPRSKRSSVGIPGAKSIIFVLPYAFKVNNNIISTEEDFINTLKYHEGTHAKQNFEANPTELGATVRFIKQYGLVECILFRNKQLNERKPYVFSNRERELEAYMRQLTAHSSGEATMSPTLESFVKSRFKQYLGVPQTMLLEIFALYNLRESYNLDVNNSTPSSSF